MNLQQLNQIKNQVIEKAEKPFEKGRGKNAEIGERREHSGKVFIKTATGWVYQAKNGTHMHYENATKKSVPASQEHVDLHAKHIGSDVIKPSQSAKPTSTAAVEPVKTETSQRENGDNLKEKFNTVGEKITDLHLELTDKKNIERQSFEAKKKSLLSEQPDAFKYNEQYGSEAKDKYKKDYESWNKKYTELHNDYSNNIDKLTKEYDGKIADLQKQQGEITDKKINDKTEDKPEEQILIGKTSSGKDVKMNNAASYDDFTAQDHQDAMFIHSKKEIEETDKAKKYLHAEAIKQHGIEYGKKLKKENKKSKKIGSLDKLNEIKESTGKNSSDEENILKIKDLVKERDGKLKRVEELRLKGYSRAKDNFSKSLFKKAINELDKVNQNIEKINVKQSEAKKIIKKLGYESSSKSTTAIRGFNRYSSGYEINNSYSPDTISFHGISKDSIEKISKELTSAGIDNNFDSGSITLGKHYYKRNADELIENK